MDFQLLTDELLEAIAADVDHHGDWLLLYASEEFPGYWEIESLDPDFFYDFENIVSRWRIVSPPRLDEFMEKARELHYQVAFFEHPDPIINAWADLNKTPDVTLNSTLENVRNGFLPWQVVGYNKFLQLEDQGVPAMLAVWDTGAGKTALEAAVIRHYLDAERIDLAMVVVKSHNKIDTQRKLKSLAGIESLVIDGELTLTRQRKGEKYEVPGPRALAYMAIDELLDAGEPVVAITNYEKFRDDHGLYGPMFKNRRVLFCWDEMPTKLSTRTTQIYDAVKYELYKTFISKPYPAWMRHLVLSATPIENDPDGLYSYANLVRPYYLGTVTDFHKTYVTKRNFFDRKPEGWGDLDKLEARLDQMTHRVSKEDPEVAAMFPSVIRDAMVIDWNPAHRAIYDRFTARAEDLLKEEESGINMMSVMGVLQMLCDAPSMVKLSAENREAFSRLVESWGDLDGDDVGFGTASGSQAALELVRALGSGALHEKGHTKLEMMREIICEKHPSEKVVVHSTWADYIFPIWDMWLTTWGVPFVLYKGTDKQKQYALDRFREDPDIRVFLSGDAGADSIDIAEASVGINYNGPWKWTTEKQREGRRDRVNSTFKTIYTYTLMMADSVEERRREVRDLKHSYHAALFEGRANEAALSARFTTSDFWYMLFGDRPEE
jgi:SNF2 family DNA or RNA helicase